METVVLTGASGFVGKGLFHYLVQNGINVVPVSRQNNSNFYFVKSYFDCPIKGVLLHLAEEPSQSKVNALGNSYFEESAKLTAYLAENYRENMIYISSAVVYGDKNSLPNKESGKVQVGDLYSRLKIKNEETVLKNGGLILRVANLYGPGMSLNNVLSDILAQKDRPGPIRVRNSTPIRDFLYIDDLFAAVLAVLRTPCAGILNIGSGQGVSILKLANIVSSILGQEGRDVVSAQTSKSESINVLDITKITELTGWIPTAKLDQHLARLVQAGEII